MTKMLGKNGMKTSAYSKKIAAYICVLAAFTAFALPMMLFCEGSGDIAGAVVKVCQDIGSLMSAILNPVCSVMFGINLFSLIFGTNSKSADAAISRIKKIIICFVCFNCIGLFLSYGTTLMQSIGGQSNWS